MKRFIIVFIFASFANLFSQNHYITGRVLDKDTKEIMIEANCLLIHLPDSLTYGASTDLKGRFSFENVKKGNYVLKISFIGYESLTQMLVYNSKSIELGNLFLKKNVVESQEIEIVAKVLPVVQNADTTEFNADAFKKNKDSDTENLLSKMPGVTVQDGKVQVLGEDVKKVLVDGKTFFGDDPSAVLRNIPAEIVEKIQVFDQQSEQSQFTGFNDGNTTKTLNVVTRVGIKQGTFGKLYGGLNEDDKYKVSGNYNIFNNDQRISILAQANNVNEQNFTPEDMLGVMSSSGGGRRGGGIGGPPPGGGRPGSKPPDRDGGGKGNFSGGDPSDFLVEQKNGLTKTIAAGLNYADKFGDKVSISGSYFYNRTKTDAISSTNRYYYPTDDYEQSYFENSTSLSTNTNHRFNMRLDFNIDSLNSLYIKPSISYQLNDGYSDASGNTLQNLISLNNISRYYNSDLTALNTSLDLLYRHKFLTKGRTISVGLTAGYKKNTGDSYLNSLTMYEYYNQYNDTTNQISNLNKKGFSLQANVQYTEPIGENSNMLINYQANTSKDDSKQYTHAFSFLESLYSLLDTSLSNVYMKKYYTQTGGVGYRYQKNKLNFTTSLNYNISKLISEETYPTHYSMEKSFYSFNPSLMLRYNITRDQNIHFFYRTSNNAPSIDKLQNIVDNSNTSQLSIGNPNLKQDYKHNLNLRYSIVDLKTMQSFFVMLSSSYANNYIANNIYLANTDTTINSVFLAKGVQLTRPENMDGYFNVRSFVSYGYMFDLIKSNLNFNISYSYSKTPSIINNVKNFSKSSNYSGGIVISSNISENLDFTIMSNSSYTDTKYDKSTSYSNSYFSQETRLRFFWQFWKGFTINTDASHQYYSGLSSSYDNNTVSWNFSIGKKIFSDYSGEIKFTINDILDQNQSVQRNTSDSYYEDSISNVLGKYYFLSFTYNIRAFN